MKIIDIYNSVDRENDPMLLIEDVLDTLVEVGNGVTDKHLHFRPATCPRCGRIFTSAQVPLRYSERSE